MTDLEREYSPSSRAGGSAEPYVADYVARSAVASATLGERVVHLPGGTRWVEHHPDAPLLVFVHGGYWQALSAADSLFLAPGALAHGWSFAAVEYTVAPAGRVPAMVEECAAAVSSLAATTHGPVVLAGHSAGAHLAAMVALVSTAPVDRVVLLSGVYDLRPLVHTSVNDALGLDEREAAALSPQLLPVAGRPQVVVAWAQDDTDAFHAQSRAYAAHVAAAGCAVTEVQLPGRHHFDVVDDLVDPSTPLGRLTLPTPR